MKKLVEIRLGGGRVHSGLVPLDALEMFQELLLSVKDEGGNPDHWNKTNTHIKVLGESSTLAALYTDRVASLRRPTSKFVRRARKRKLNPRGRGFVIEHFKPGSTWDYAEVITGDKKREAVRFDHEYREMLMAEPAPLQGVDEIYATVLRVGGDPPTAQLDIPGQGKRTHKVASKALARELSPRLYETVKITAEVTWHRESLDIIELRVTGVDTDWRDVHLAQVVDGHGGVLPVELSVTDTGDLLAKRRRERQED